MGLALILVIPEFRNIGFYNTIGQVVLFTFVVCIPISRTGRMSYVDIAWPWGLVLLGIVSYIFGTKYMGLLYGVVFLSHQVGSFFGAYLGGIFKEVYGSYDYAWYVSIALSIFAGLIHLPIKEKQVKRLSRAY